MTARPWPPSPLNFPEPLVSGEWTVGRYQQPAGTKVDVVTPRTSLFTGQPAVSHVLEEPLEIHQLTQGGRGGVWMSDCPAELVAMHAFAESARGDVLVGGLGLGIVVRYLAMNPRVRSVTVVERERDVLDLIGPGLRRDVKVPVRLEHMRLERFLEKLPAWPYGSAFFDTWTGTGVTTWAQDVVPLRRLVWRRFGGRHVECWSEEEMHGQVLLALGALGVYVRERGHQPAAPGSGSEAVFLRAAARCVPGGKTWADLVRLFVRSAGSPLWEARFGAAWDARMSAKENP